MTSLPSIEEEKRLAALDSYNILDSLPEQDYEDITQLAAQICNTPVALISLVDSERQWFKARRGISFQQTPREESFCAYNLAAPARLLVVPDARVDERFRTNPLVTGNPHIVFYAGESLVDEDGLALGSLCVIDSQPRQLDAGQLKALKILAHQVVTLLSARRKAIQADLLRRQLQESELRFRSLVEQSTTAMLLLTGRDLVITTANQPMLAMMSEDRLTLGKPLREAMPELAGQPFLTQLDEVFTRGIGYEGRNMPTTVLRDGQLVTGYFDLSYQPIRNAQGEVIAILNVSVDVTDRELARQQQLASNAQKALLLRLSDGLRSLTNATDMQQLAATLLGEYLGADRAGFAEDLQDGQTIRVIHNYLDNVPSMEGNYSYDDFGPALLRAFRAGQTVVRPDILNDATLTAAEKRAHADLSMGATINIPLLKNNQLTLILFVHFRQAHDWTPDDIGLCREVGERTWLAIERIRAEEALRQSEMNFRAMFESMEEGYVVCEAIRDQTGRMVNYRFVQVNPAFERLTRLVAEQTIGRTAWDVLPGLDPKFYAVYQQALDSRQPIRLEDYIPPLNEWYSLTAFYFGPEQFAVLFDEITERKQAEEKLRQSEERYRQLAAEQESRVQARTQELSLANQDLKRSNDNLQQFAYVASHDLQEPLRKIQSFSTLLTQQLDRQLDESSRMYLERITAAGAKMSTLIKDLLNYSRIATRQQAFGSVSLAAILTSVLSTLDWEIQQTGAQVTLDELPLVQGDESQLSQLFQNLLTNALKFVQPGQAPVIHIQYFYRSIGELPPGVHPSRQVAHYHQISVGDNGMGFDVRFLDRIFQVFQRLHGKHQFPGTGVGLAICQRVVENHGGGITASSQPGQGATFCVYLPA